MTTTSIYQPTFLEKLLGKNYKWWYLLSYSFRSYNVHRASSFFGFLSRFIALLSVLVIWYVALGKNANVLDFNYIFTYYLIGNLLSFINTAQSTISNSIKDGKITTFLLRPSNIWLQWYLTNLGWNLFIIFSEFFITLTVIIIGFNYFLAPSSLLNLFLYIVLSLMGYICLVLFNFISGFSAFFYIENWGILRFSETFPQYFSGKTFPLNLIWFVQPLAFLPFAFNFYHPMQIYLGKYSTNEIILVFIGGLAWCLVLYFLAKLVFKLGLKRNESVGL